MRGRPAVADDDSDDNPDDCCTPNNAHDCTKMVLSSLVTHSACSWQCGGPVVRVPLAQRADLGIPISELTFSVSQMLLPNLSFTTCARRKGSAPRRPRIHCRSRHKAAAKLRNASDQLVDPRLRCGMATVVAFHAHPDDEVVLTGGTLARIAAEGHRVVVVAATDGFVGEPPNFTSTVDRIAELEASARVLGLHRVVHLGYAG
jgi:hypothetical protein